LDAIRAAITTGDIPQNVNFAISLDVLAKFLAKNKVAFRESPTSTPLDTARVAELAQSFTYRVECERKSQPQAPAVAGRSPKASEPDGTRRGPTESELSRARTGVIQKIKETRSGAEKLIALHESERDRALKLYEQTREKYDQGLVGHDELLKAESTLAQAIVRIDEDRRWLAETDLIIKEAGERDKLLRNQPSR
jgi:hypothetical protein